MTGSGKKTKTKGTPRTINNLEVYDTEYRILVSVNPKIYPLEVVQSALYAMMDKVYGVIDGDPQNEILVELKPKEKRKNLLELGYSFNNELLNYAVYKVQSEKNKNFRDVLIQKALNQNMPEPIENSLDNGQNKNFCGTELLDDGTGQSSLGGAIPQDVPTDPKEVTPDYIKDPLGIAEPWSEKKWKKSKLTKRTKQ